jgi:hypothetical protein
VKLPALRAALRSRLDDEAQPYLWSDADLNRYLNESVNEAALRARLIRDASTAAVCNVTVTAADGTYTLHTSVFAVKRAKLDLGSVPLVLSSTEALDVEYPTWATQSASSPSHLLIDPQSSALGITIVPTPTVADTLRLVVYRLPLEAMASDDDEPELHSMHHERLLDWAVRCAYLKHDSETFDAQKAKSAEDAFELSFGRRPDANVLRKQEQRPTHQVAFLEL